MVSRPDERFDAPRAGHRFDPDAGPAPARADVEPVHAISATPATEHLPDSDATRVGRQLAAQLEARDYHPVVVFGSSAAGKTTLLTSLLAYLQVDDAAQVEVELGAPFAIDDEGYGRWAHEEATGLFFRSVEEFIAGRTQPATMSPRPFFVPVVIRPPGRLPEMRFAFLESRGDWYNPDTASNAFFRRLRDEIAAVLLHYPKGISFLHVAPYTQLATWDPDAGLHEARDAALRGQADLALVGALNAYRAVRAVKHRDAHLLLLTKWDAHAAPDGSESTFIAPALDEVVDVARERYPRGFAAFGTLALGAAQPWQKQVMQYCAGIISGRTVTRPGGELREQLHRYPRVLWNWLYENATRDAGQRRGLFPRRRSAHGTWSKRVDGVLARVLRLLGV